MTNKEIVNTLEFLKIAVLVDAKPMNVNVEALDLAIKAIEVRPQGEWIPVSERLPDDGEEVLTCRNGGFREIQSFEHGDYWENQNGDCTDFDEDEVIAWQPLPEPYKEAEH